MADPRLRIALEKVANEANDAAVVEALAALEALERDERTLSPARGRKGT
jgi:hypothetical protein